MNVLSELQDPMLVIFDCDGVLVDSESLAAEVFSALLAKFKIHLSPAQCYQQFHGHALANCFSWIEQSYAVRLPKDFAAQLGLATRERFAKDLQPMAGVKQVLSCLQKRNIPFCVASNGEHRKIRYSLSITGLDCFFEPVFKNGPRQFSVEDVAKGKPAPDLFLYAAESMGVPPQYCTVVEDSAAGFAAAKAAGMRLIQFLPEEQSQIGGERCCCSMGELPSLLFS